MLIQRPLAEDIFARACREMHWKRRLHVCLIQGGSGAGKTSLIQLFHRSLEAQHSGFLLYSGACDYYENYSVPYQPFKDLLKRLLLKITAATPPEASEEALLYAAQMFTEHAPDLFENFVSANQILRFSELRTAAPPVATDYLLDGATILEQFAASLRAIVRRYPVVVFLDNLQWLDHASASLILQLIERLQDCPILLTGAYCPDRYSATTAANALQAWKTKPYCSVIDLEQIGIQDHQWLLESVLDVEPNNLDDRFRNQLLQYTQGNPRRVAEALQWLKSNHALVHQPDGRWSLDTQWQWSAFPREMDVVIQDKIASLDKDELHLLTHASVQGNTFLAPVLSRTWGESEHKVLMALAQLGKERHLVFVEPTSHAFQGMGASYHFVNPLVQQHLYHLLNPAQRKYLHAGIAEVLEELFKDRTEEVAGEIARHAELGDDLPKALAYNKQIVESMLRISAFRDAIGVLEKAQSMLRRMFQDDETRQELLEIQVRLCICYRYIKGWGHSDMALMYQNARKMSDELQDHRFMDTILFGLWTIHFTRLELNECLQMATANLQLAQQKKSITMQKSALISLANTHVWMGHISRATQALEVFWNLSESLESYSSEGENEEAFALLFSYLMAARTRNRVQQDQLQMQLRDRLRSTRNQVCATLYMQALAWNAALYHDLAVLQEYAGMFLTNSRQLHLVFYEGIALLFHGYLQAQHDYPQGIATIESGYHLLMEHNQCNVVIMHSVYGLLLNRAHLEARQLEAVAESLPGIIARSEARNERLYLAELYALQSRYYETSGDNANAAAWSSKAQLEQNWI